MVLLQQCFEDQLFILKLFADLKIIEDFEVFCLSELYLSIFPVSENLELLNISLFKGSSRPFYQPKYHFCLSRSNIFKTNFSEKNGVKHCRIYTFLQTLTENICSLVPANSYNIVFVHSTCQIRNFANSCPTLYLIPK